MDVETRDLLNRVARKADLLRLALMGVVFGLR
jgi:hypothetical protein